LSPAKNACLPVNWLTSIFLLSHAHVSLGVARLAVWQNKMACVFLVYASLKACIVFAMLCIFRGALFYHHTMLLMPASCGIQFLRRGESALRKPRG